MIKLLTTVILCAMLSTYATAQNVGLGVNTPLQKLHINGHVMIDSAYFLEFGGRLTKEVNAGKIGYALFTPGNLDIVGAGSTVGSRSMKFWNEGVATFRGRLYLETHEISTAKVGNGNNLLPIGFAWVQANGSKSGGTINITSSFVTDHYVINMGEAVTGALAFVTPNAGTARYATVINGSPTEFWVYIWTSAGAKTQQGFNIVVYKQ